MTCIHTHKRGMETLLDYCAGRLAAEQAEALEKHARECGDCRALLAAQTNLWTALDQLEAPEISADFDARLYARLNREKAPSAWRALYDRIVLSDFMAGSWKPALVGVAGAAVLAIGLLVHAPHAQDSAAQVRPDSVDVEQLEVTLQDLEMLTPPSASAGKPSAGKM